MTLTYVVRCCLSSLWYVLLSGTYVVPGALLHMPVLLVAYYVRSKQIYTEVTRHVLGAFFFFIAPLFSFSKSHKTCSWSCSQPFLCSISLSRPSSSTSSTHPSSLYAKNNYYNSNYLPDGRYHPIPRPRCALAARRMGPRQGPPSRAESLHQVGMPSV